MYAAFGFVMCAAFRPDGIAFGKSGKLSVALAGTSRIRFCAQVKVHLETRLEITRVIPVILLRPDGTEEVRYSGPAANPGGALDPTPLANSANIAFEKKTGSLLVTNHASLVPFDPNLFLCLQRVR